MLYYTPCLLVQLPFVILYTNLTHAVAFRLLLCLNASDQCTSTIILFLALVLGFNDIFWYIQYQQYPQLYVLIFDHIVVSNMFISWADTYLKYQTTHPRPLITNVRLRCPDINWKFRLAITCTIYNWTYSISHIVRGYAVVYVTLAIIQ